MRSYLVTITQKDGTQFSFPGLYADGFDAQIALIGEYPDARRISARRVL